MWPNLTVLELYFKCSPLDVSTELNTQNFILSIKYAHKNPHFFDQH